MCKFWCFIAGRNLVAKIRKIAKRMTTCSPAAAAVFGGGRATLICDSDWSGYKPVRAQFERKARLSPKSKKKKKLLHPRR